MKRKKNCKITIEYLENNPISGFNGKIIRIYTFNDYRIATAVSNLLDNINSKWIKKECHYIKSPSDDFMNKPE